MTGAPGAASGADGVRFAPLADAAARDAYAALAAVSPQRTPFAGLAFADAACAAFGYAGRIALALAPDGAATIGAVLFEKRTGPFRQAVVPPLTPYTGPLLREAVGLASAARLGAFLAAVTARYDAVAFQPPPAVSDVRPFTWAGFEATPRYTYRGETADLLAAPYVRTAVRKYGPLRADGSVRDGGTAARRDDRAARDAVEAMAQALGRARHPMPVGAARAERLLGDLVAAGAARVVVAERRGERVGAVATLTDDCAGHAWIGAGTPGPALLLLLAATAESLAADGVGAFDLAGANLARVSAFKRRFGLPLAVSYRVAWTGSRALRLRDALRRALRAPETERLPADGGRADAGRADADRADG